MIVIKSNTGQVTNSAVNHYIARFIRVFPVVAHTNNFVTYDWLMTLFKSMNHLSHMMVNQSSGFVLRNDYLVSPSKHTINHITLVDNLHLLTLEQFKRLARTNVHS